MGGTSEPTWTMRMADLLARLGAPGAARRAYASAAARFADEGFLRRAITAYRRAMELTSLRTMREEMIALALGLSRVLEEEGVPHEAVQMLLGLRARLVAEANDGATAAVLALQERIVELDPDRTTQRLGLADLLAQAARPDAAADEYVACVTLLLARGESHRVLPVLERLLAERPDPRHARLAAELYVARGQRGDGARALSALQHCVIADLEMANLVAAAAALAAMPSDAALASSPRSIGSRRSSRASSSEVVIPLVVRRGSSSGRLAQARSA